MYFVFDLLTQLVENNVNPTIELLYYEDEENYKDEVELEISLETIHRELSPLALAHWEGSESYNAIKDEELKRLKALGPEGRALANLWEGGEGIDEILSILSHQLLGALVKILTDTSGHLARQVFMARSVEELPEAQVCESNVVRDLAEIKLKQLSK